MTMAKAHEGFHTVESLAGEMGIGRGTAINYLHEMRSRGYVETERGARGRRLYKISPLRLRKIGYPGLIETINMHSSLKLEAAVEERSDHMITAEEAIVRAILTQDFRVIMASLELFRKVRDWWSLYRLAKEHGVERHAGALYSLSRTLFRVRSMDGRVLALLKKSKTAGEYVIKGMKGHDFEGMSKEWGMAIPFNRQDLERLKR